MAVEIREVKSKKELNQFIDLPYDLYKNDPHWVPPLKLSVKDILSPKHPFYNGADAKMYLAYKDGKPVGRIMAIINQEHNRFHEEKCGFFGFFESSEDKEVGHALFKAAKGFLRKGGMDLIRGPVNPSTNYECGVLVDGFQDNPQVMMTYNPPYYEKLIENEGMKKAKDLIAYQLPTNITMPDKIQRIGKRVSERNKVQFRNLNKKNWQQEVENMWEIYNSAWEKNWGFIPMTKEEFYHTAKDLKSVVDEKLVFFAEVQGKPAAFLVALPDLNQVFKEIPNGKLLPFGLFKLLSPKRYINRVRVITLGVKEEFRLMGLETLLYLKIQEAVLSYGQYEEAEMSWILEDNVPMNRPLQAMGAKPYKTYRIYERLLH